MKKIVFFIERLSTGGAERVVAALANEICRSEIYEVYLITYLSEENDEYKILPKINRIALSQPKIGRISLIYHKYKELKRIINSIQPYCVFSLAIPKTDAVMMMAFRKRNFPIIISERNDPEHFPVEKSMKVLRNFVYRRCEGLVFQTLGAKKYFDNIITCKNKIICNPITSTLPKRYDGEREHRIVNFCRIEPQKNLKLTIDAFKIISKEFPDYTLEFYGEGSQKKELEEYVKKIRLNNVIFHGYTSGIHEKIIKASLYVSSSNYEGISNSMLEAMAIGLPTICTDCPPGGAKSVITNGENGILVPVNNIEKLANAMRKVLHNKSLQLKISTNASLIVDKLNVNTIAKQWLDFAEELRQEMLK